MKTAGKKKASSMEHRNTENPSIITRAPHPTTNGYHDNVKALEIALRECRHIVPVSFDLASYVEALEIAIVNVLDLWSKVYKKYKVYNTSAQYDSNLHGQTIADLMSGMKLLHGIVAFIRMKQSLDSSKSSIRHMCAIVDLVLSSDCFLRGHILDAARDAVVISIVDFVWAHITSTPITASDLRSGTKQSESLLLYEKLTQSMHHVYSRYSEVVGTSFGTLALISERLFKLKILHQVLSISTMCNNLLSINQIFSGDRARLYHMQISCQGLLCMKTVLAMPVQRMCEMIANMQDTLSLMHEKAAYSLHSQKRLCNGSHLRLVDHLNSTFGPSQHLRADTVLHGDSLNTIKQLAYSHLDQAKRALTCSSHSFMSLTSSIRFSEAICFFRAEMAEIDDVCSYIRTLANISDEDNRHNTGLQTVIKKYVVLRQALLLCEMAYIRAWRLSAYQMIKQHLRSNSAEMVDGYVILVITEQEQMVLEYLNIISSPQYPVSTSSHSNHHTTSSFISRISQLRSVFSQLNHSIYMIVRRSHSYSEQLKALLGICQRQIYNLLLGKNWTELMNGSVTLMCHRMLPLIETCGVLFTNLTSNIERELSTFSASRFSHFGSRQHAHKDESIPLNTLIIEYEHWLQQSNITMRCIFTSTLSCVQACCLSLSAVLELSGHTYNGLDEQARTQVEALLSGLAADIQQNFAARFLSVVELRSQNLIDLVRDSRGSFGLALKMIYGNGTFATEPRTSRVLQYIDQLLSLHRAKAVQFAENLRWQSCVASIDAAAMLTRRRIVKLCQDALASLNTVFTPYAEYLPLFIQKPEDAVLALLRRRPTVGQLEAECKRCQIWLNTLNSDTIPTVLAHCGFRINCRQLHEDMRARLQRTQHVILLNLTHIVKLNTISLRELLCAAERIPLLESSDSYDVLAEQLCIIDRKLEAINHAHQLIGMHPFLRADQVALQLLIERRHMLSDVMQRVSASTFAQGENCTSQSLSYSAMSMAPRCVLSDAFLPAWHQPLQEQQIFIDNYLGRPLSSFLPIPTASNLAELNFNQYSLTNADQSFMGAAQSEVKRLQLPTQHATSGNSEDNTDDGNMNSDSSSSSSSDDETHTLEVSKQEYDALLVQDNSDDICPIELPSAHYRYPFSIEQVDRLRRQFAQNLQLLLQASTVSGAVHGAGSTQDIHWKEQLTRVCEYTQKRVSRGHILSPSITLLWQSVDAVQHLQESNLRNPIVKGQLQQFRSNFTPLPCRVKPATRTEPVLLPECVLNIFSFLSPILDSNLLPNIVREKMPLRSVYTSLDDELLIVGLKYFGMHLDTIRSFCLPTKTTYSLYNRYNNRKRRLTPNNSVKNYHLSLVKPLTVFESWTLIQAVQFSQLSFESISEHYLATRTGSQLRLAYGEMVLRGLNGVSKERAVIVPTTQSINNGGSTMQLLDLTQNTNLRIAKRKYTDDEDNDILYADDPLLNFFSTAIYANDTEQQTL